MPASKQNSGFVHPEWMSILVLLATATAMSLPLVRRLELSLFWLPLFVMAFATGITLFLIGLGMIIVRVSDMLESRRREKRRHGFAGHELLIVIAVFGVTIAFALGFAQGLTQSLDISAYWIPVIALGFLAGLVGIFFIYGKLYMSFRRWRRKRTRSRRPCLSEHGELPSESSEEAAHLRETRT